MTLEEYRKELASHDWHFGYSDDGDAYLRGMEAHTRLMRIAVESGDEFKKLFNDEAEKRNHVRPFLLGDEAR